MNHHNRNTLSVQKDRLSSLEECCTMLAASTKNLETQLATMNGNIYNAINNMNTSPKRHLKKGHKSADNPAMDLDP
jgi:hypothetical protein